MIEEYRIVYGQDSKELTVAVGAMLRDGWQPFGSIATLATSDAEWTGLYQPMVKHSDVPPISQEEEARRGQLLADVLELKRDHAIADRWSTTWGTKTNLGLYATAKRILTETDPMP